MPSASRNAARHAPKPVAATKRAAVITSSDTGVTRDDALAARIGERIRKRLGPRIRELAVVVDNKSIVLTGRCSTYYSKQLAQHAALGVIEDETLENNIEVAVGR